MRAKDLRERNLEELRELEMTLSRDAFQNRFKNFTNRLDDTSLLKKARRDLARVKTLIRQVVLGKGVVGVAGEAPKAPAPPKSKPAAKPKAPKAELKAPAAPKSKPAKAEAAEEKAPKSKKASGTAKAAKKKSEDK